MTLFVAEPDYREPVSENRPTADTVSACKLAGLRSTAAYVVTSSAYNPGQRLSGRATMCARPTKHAVRAFSIASVVPLRDNAQSITV